MKIIIYIKNSNNQYINRLLVNDKNILNSQNINNTLLNELRRTLKEINLKVDQFKCIGKNSYAYYYILKINTEEANLSIQKYQIEDFNSNIRENKMLLRYKKKILKEKNLAVIGAFSNKFKFNDILLLIFELIILTLTIILKFKDTNFETGLDVFIISIFILLLSTLEKVFNGISSAITFNNMCKHSSTFNIVNDPSVKHSKDQIKKTVIENYQLSKVYNEFENINLDNKDTFIYSNKENENLKNKAKSIKVDFVKKDKTLNNKSRIALAHIIGEKLNDDKTIFNGKLIGINSDLIFKKNSTVEIKKVRYHNYVSIDEMIYRNIFTPLEKYKLIKGTDICLNPLTNSLLDIKNSELTNLIGVNLIVEIKIKDKIYYIINEQSAYNDVNQERFVPSSSGSLDLNDYKRFSKFKDSTKNFENLLLLGMLRELHEESYLDFKLEKDQIINQNNFEFTNLKFNLLGFGRLLSKAGKPDFFGKLSVEAKDLNILKEILDNYNSSQNKFLGTKNELETVNMHIIEKDELLKISNSRLSAQLQYVIFLLNK